MNHSGRPVTEIPAARSYTTVRDSTCGGSYKAKETVRLRRVQVNEDSSGSFDAESLYESADAPGFEGVQIFGTCKWAYERVSTSNPRVPRC
jgi:hypothetical protein